MELAKVTRRLDADQQRANRKSKKVIRRTQIEVPNAQHEKVGDDGVEEAP
jgi:hypothetical protein